MQGTFFVRNIIHSHPADGNQQEKTMDHLISFVAMNSIAVCLIGAIVRERWLNHKKFLVEHGFC